MHANKSFDVVVVGGGPAGRTVARMVRMNRPEMSVLVVKEHEVNPNRCVIPYILDDTVPFEQGMIPNDLVTGVGAELLAGTVESIDPAGHCIKVNGHEIGFTHLVLATGSRPVVPDIPGTGLANVFVVRDREDIRSILDSRGRARRAVVAGMGLIGAEVAAALARTGLDVTGVDILPHCLGTVLDDDHAALADGEMRKGGVELRLGVPVSELTGGLAVSSVTVGGEPVPADMVVLAVGVQPNIELARAAGIKCSGHGIHVDEQQRTDHPNIYAVGDCAASWCFVTGSWKQSRLGTTAVIQARVAAKTILGQPAAFRGTLGTWACQLFDLPIGGAGLRSCETVDYCSYILGESNTLSQYPQMPNVRPVHTRLVFEASELKLLGAQIAGTFAVAGYLDMLNLAIQYGMTANDLANSQYATHPELAPRPSDNLVVMAAMDAIRRKKENPRGVTA